MEKIMTSEEIKITLNVLGVRQSEIADTLSIKRPHISAVLAGKRNGYDTRKRITEHFLAKYPDIKKVIKSKFGDLIFDEPVEEIEVTTLS